MPHLLESREIPHLEVLQKALWSGQYGPNQALEELQAIKIHHTTRQQILNDLGQRNKQNLKDFPVGTLEALLKEADLTKLSSLQQEALLEAIKDHKLRYMRLRNCVALTGAKLAYLNLEQIIKLDLTGCTNLTEIATGMFMRSSVYMPALTHIKLDNAKIKTIRLEAPHLISLSACSCTQLEKVDIIALEPKTINLEKVDTLSEEAIKVIFKNFY